MTLSKSYTFAILLWTALITKADKRFYNNYEYTDAEVLRDDLLGGHLPESKTDFGRLSGPYDFDWSRYDELGQTDRIMASMNDHDEVPGLDVSHCQRGLFTLPDSMDKFCITSHAHKKPLANAPQDCLEWGFDGLLEIRSKEDWEYYKTAVRLACEKNPGEGVWDEDCLHGKRYFGARMVNDEYRWFSDDSLVDLLIFGNSDDVWDYNKRSRNHEDDPFYTQCCLPSTCNYNGNDATGDCESYIKVEDPEGRWKPFVCMKKFHPNDLLVNGSLPLAMEYTDTACEPIQNPTNTKVKNLLPPGSLNNKNYFFSCNKEPLVENMDRIEHELRSLSLPALRSSYMTFHHICGLSSSGGIPCNVSVVRSAPKFLQHKNESRRSDLLVHEVSDANLFNTDGALVDSTSEWNFEYVPLPKIDEESKLQLKAVFDLATGAAGFDNIHIRTEQKCIPRWTKIPGYELAQDMAQIHQPEIANFERTTLSNDDLAERYYMAQLTQESLEYCARHCLMGASCDMFEYESSSGDCNFYPNLQLKDRHTWEVMRISSSSTRHIYVLHCSGAQENLLINNDFSFNSDYSWEAFVPGELGITEQIDKTAWKSAVNGGYRQNLATVCPNADEDLKIKTEIFSTNLPMKMTNSYLELVKPVMYFRSWVNVVDEGNMEGRSGSNHNVTLGMKLDKNGEADHFTLSIPKTFEESTSSDLEISSVVTNQGGFDSITLDQTVTISSANSFIRMGPIELLIDVPIHIGCFRGKATLDVSTKTTISGATPPKCLEKCLTSGKRYGGLSQGSDCLCYSYLPSIDMNIVDDSQCSMECSGDPKQSCGGDQNLIDFFVATCPQSQGTRFGDSCYQDGGEYEIFQNIDACMNSDGHLWYPETRAEIDYVTTAFPATNQTYHLGIRSFHKRDGMTYSDNSFGIGIPFITHDKEGTPILNDNGTMMNQDHCVILDASGSEPVIREESTGCPTAKAVCKNKMVHGYGYGRIGHRLVHRLKTSKLNSVPMAVSGNAPFHMQLENDVAVTNRFVEVTLPSQIIMTGLYMITPRSNAVKTFGFKYISKGIRDPQTFSEFTNSFGEILTFTSYFGTKAAQRNPITRNFMFPNAIVTSRFRIEILSGDIPAVFKFDVIGVEGRDKYEDDPVVDPVEYIDSKPNRVLDNSVAIHWFDPEAEQICPGGRVYVRMIPKERSQFSSDETVALLELLTVSGDISLSLHFSLNPFRVVRKTDGPNGEHTVTQDHGPFPTGPYYHRPLDVEIECTETSYEIYFDGILFESFTLAHVNGPDKAIPKIGRLEIRNRDNVHITSLHWTWVPPLGILRWFASVYKDNTNNIWPYINKADNYYGERTFGLWQEAAIVRVYFDNQRETFFQPFQADQMCFRTGRGNVRCHTISGSFNSDANQGYGGNGGLYESGCTGDFEGLGYACVSFPIQDPNYYNRKTEFCSGNTVMYAPTSVLQDNIMAAWMSRNSIETMWIDVVRVSGSDFSIAGELLDDFKSNWAPGEPKDTLECVVMDANLNYKWRVESCDNQHNFFCMVKAPTCPKGYTWVPELGRTCLKVVGKGHEVYDHHDTGVGFYDQPQMDKICSLDGARLAAPETDDEMRSMYKWFESQQGTEKFWLGMKRWIAGNGDDIYGLLSDTFLSQQFSPGNWDFPEDETSAPNENSCFFVHDYKTYTKSCGIVGYTSAPGVYGLCQYVECDTILHGTCQFPFKYQGRVYDTCILLNGKSMCSVDVDENRNALEGSMKECHSSCTYSECPVGYYRSIFSHTCYKISSPTVDDMKPTFEAAADSCRQQGARLYQIRDIDSFYRLLDVEQYHLKGKHFHDEIFSQSFTALGMTYTNPDADSPLLIYNDGTPVPQEILDSLPWENDFPSNVTNHTCIAITEGKLRNVPCDGYNNGEEPLTFSNVSALGYLCEARPIYTLDNPKELCHFPFTYNGKVYDSCSHDVISSINPGGEPWCALQVDENGVMIDGAWSLCQDERNMIYTQRGSGEICPFPFIFDGSYYDTCTRNLITGQQGLEDVFWCPDPDDLNENGEFSDTSAGHCLEFSYPKENGCTEHYEPMATSGMCAKLEAYETTYEDALARCRSEGAELAEITSEAIENHIISYINSKKNSYERFKTLQQVWVGASVNADSEWKWNTASQDFENYMQWEQDTVSIGCHTDGCSGEENLVIRPDNDYKWNAVLRDSTLPYLCVSTCAMGYKWYPTVKKCLKVFEPEDSAVLIGEAAATCSLDGAKLVTLDTCDKVKDLSVDLFDRFMVVDQEFFIGAFLYTSNDDPYATRAYLQQSKTIDFLGYPNNIEHSGDEICGTRTPETDPMDTVNGNFMGISLLSENSYNTFHHPFLTNFSTQVTKGFICEKEEELMCPTGYFMFGELCYKVHQTLKTHSEAEMLCRDENAKLADPRTHAQNQFLVGLLMVTDSAGTLEQEFWLDPRREDGESNFMELANRFAASNQNASTENCVVIDRESGLHFGWKLKDCANDAAFICQTGQIINSKLIETIPKAKSILPLSKKLKLLDIADEQTNEISSVGITYDRLWTPAGLIGSTLMSNHPESYLVVDAVSFAGATGFTFSAHVKFFDFATPHTIFDFRDDGSDEGLFLEANEQLMIYMTPNPSTDGPEFYSANPTMLLSNQWYFIAFTYDSLKNEGTFVIDGAYGYSDGTNVFYSKYFSSSNANWFKTKALDRNMFIGTDFMLTAERKFFGALSCVQIFTDALSPVELQYQRSCPIVETRKDPECPDGYELFYGNCYKSGGASLTFSDAEISCMPTQNALYREQMAAPMSHRVLDLLSVWFSDKYGHNEFWVGLDDRDEDGNWETSDGSPGLLSNSEFFLNGMSGSLNCAKKSGSNGGYLTTDECSKLKQFICSRKPFSSKPDYPCPGFFYPYQDGCYMPVRTEATYNAAENYCAQRGSIIMPVKDKGEHEFILTFAKKYVRRDVFLGMRFLTVDRYYDANPDLHLNLIDIVSQDLSYSDGTLFDPVDGYKLGTSGFNGPCEYLKASINYVVRPTKCGVPRSFICKWTGLECPANYTVLGAISDGRTCHSGSVPITGTSVNVGCAANGGLVSQRWNPYSYEATVSLFEHEGPLVGNRWLDFLVDGNGTLRTSSGAFLLSDYINDMSFRETWLDGDLIEGNETACASLGPTGFVRMNVTDSCSENLKATCEYRACMTKRGKQCIFPYIYRNKTHDNLEYNMCSVSGIYRAWCPTSVDANRNVLEWDECLDDCPQEKVESVCIMEPNFPAFGDGMNSVNYTTWYQQGSKLPTAELDHIEFVCPEGYVFKDSFTNVQYAICMNWTFFYTYETNKPCVPIECPPAPWFQDGTVVGIWNYDTNLKIREYQHKIEYHCPKGYVFELPNSPYDPTKNWGLIEPETDFLEIECALWGDWDPSQVPRCIPRNCTSDPFRPPMNDRGLYDWDELNRPKSYGTVVKYTCPLRGWGFSSTGGQEIVSQCQADKTWNVTDVDLCIKLPCSQTPPGAPTGGWSEFQFDKVQYHCPNGLIFDGDIYPHYLVNCTAEKRWDPLEVPECVYRRCATDPPLPYQNMDRDWPHKSHELGAEVRYICPTYKTTLKESLIEQIVQCIWDKDLNEMMWFPFDVEPCTGKCLLVNFSLNLTLNSISPVKKSYLESNC